MIEDKTVEELGILYTTKRELEPEDLNPVIYKPPVPIEECLDGPPDYPTSLEEAEAEILQSHSGCAVAQAQVLQFASQNQVTVLSPVRTIQLQPQPQITPPAPIILNRNQGCCQIHSIYWRNNFSNNTVILGHCRFYCEELTCEKDPCINYRVKRKHIRYMDSFASLCGASGGPVDIFYEQSNVNNIDVIQKRFKSYLIFNCHDHIRIFAAIPRKNNKDLSIYIKMNQSDYQTLYLIDALKHHVVRRQNQTVKNFGFGKKQILSRKIGVYKPPKTYPTINGHYAEFYQKGDGGGIVKEPVMRKRREDVIWDVHPILPNGVDDMTKWIEISGSILFNIYKQRIEELWDINFE
jgi:hypothetical protein